MGEDRGRLELGLGRKDQQGAAASSSARQQAFSSTERLEEGTRQLEAAARQALETETVSEEVLTDLGSQRELIQSVRSSMRTIGTELSQARQSLGRMLHRAQQNRLMTLVIMFVLGFGLLVWACCFFGLGLKETVLVASSMLLLGGAAVLIRRQLKLRAGR